MATAKEREEFIVLFCSEYLGKRAPCQQAHVPRKFTMAECLAAARSLLRLARTHGHLAVQYCNGPEHLNCGIRHEMPIEQFRAMQADWETDLEKRQERCNKRIREVCAGFKLPVILGGDPRGYTVKVKFPSGRYNTWGGVDDGWGVPQ